MSESKIIGLAIESATKTASVALIEKIESDVKIIGEMTLNGKLNHSETLLPMIDSLCKVAQFNVKDLDFIAVSKGPGSYTGLRIGVSVAKGIARVANAKIIGVSTINTLSLNGKGGFIVCPMIDARRQHAYSAIYKNDGGDMICLLKPELRSVEEFVQKANNIVGNKHYLGDGCISHRSIILDNVKDDNFILGTDRENTPFASLLANIGLNMFENKKYSNYNDFVPDYFRNSQAKRMLNIKNGNK